MPKKISVKNAEKFMNWLWSKYIFYGDPFLIWWKERGAADFIKWALKRGLKYMDENKLNANTRL
jgi:hypothetical protein